MVAVVGEVGVGKSRLAASAAATSARRSRRSSCWATVLALLAVVGEAHGAFMVLEDLHWADPGTLELLDYGVDKLDGFGAVVVATVRTGEGSAAKKQVRQFRARRQAEVIELHTRGLYDPKSGVYWAVDAFACLLAGHVTDTPTSRRSCGGSRSGGALAHPPRRQQVRPARGQGGLARHEHGGVGACHHPRGEHLDEAFRIIHQVARMDVARARPTWTPAGRRPATGGLKRRSS